MMVEGNMLLLLAAIASAQNLLLSNNFIPVDQLIASYTLPALCSCDISAAGVWRDRTANRGYIFQKGFKTGFKFERIVEGGRCACRKVVPCLSAKGNCFRARDCFDEAKLKRCTRLRECGAEQAQELKKTFKGAVACGTGEEADLSSGARQGLVSRFKEFIDETCDLKACKYDDDADVSSYDFNLPSVKSKDKRNLRKCLNEQVYEDTETGCFVASNVEDLAFMTTTAPTTADTTTVVTTIAETTTDVTTAEATTADATTSDATTTEVTTEVTTTEQVTTVIPYTIDVYDLSSRDILLENNIELEFAGLVNGYFYFAAAGDEPVVSPLGWQCGYDDVGGNTIWRFVNNDEQVLSPAELASNNETLGDLVNITFEIEGDIGGNIMLQILTKPTATNDVSSYHGSWLVLGSTMGLPAGSVSPSQAFTANFVGGADVEPVTNTVGGSFSDDGDWAASADDVIMAISFMTDRSYNSSDFTLKSFTVTYADRMQQFLLANESRVDELTLDSALLASDIELEGGVFIDGSALIAGNGLKPMVAQSGWGFTKIILRSKIKWYFVSNFDQVVSPPELASRGETLGDLISVSFGLVGDARGQVFIRIYTKPTGTNDASDLYHGSWLISSAALGIPASSILEAETFKGNLLDGADVSPVTNDDSGSFSDDGDWAANQEDEIMAISFETDSRVNGYSFHLRSFVVIYANRVQQFDLVPAPP